MTWLQPALASHLEPTTLRVDVATSLKTADRALLPVAIFVTITGVASVFAIVSFRSMDQATSP